MKKSLARIGLALVLLTAVATPAMAQIEVGASLVNVAFLKPSFGDTTSTIGIPSSPFGILQPGVYFSAALTPKIAAEGNLGLALISGGGDSFHLLNLGGQVDYFTKGSKETSPYVFGGVGVVHATDSGSTATFSFGAGYRKVMERLTLRFLGRYTRITDDGGNMFDFGVTIGGLFGK